MVHAIPVPVTPTLPTLNTSPHRVALTETEADSTRQLSFDRDSKVKVVDEIDLLQARGLIGAADAAPKSVDSLLKDSGAIPGLNLQVPRRRRSSIGTKRKTTEPSSASLQTSALQC